MSNSHIQPMGWNDIGVPSKAPNAQSRNDTPVTPQAIFNADHGTRPIKRKTDRRVQAEVRLLEFEREVSSFIVPSRALRVRAIGLGKNRVRSGANGMASALERREPIVVRTVIRIVAKIGWKSAPANTF